MQRQANDQCPIGGVDGCVDLLTAPHGCFAAFGEAELQRELERGRLRADIVSLFGALQEEWTAHRGGSGETDALDAAKGGLLELALRHRDGSPHPGFLINCSLPRD